MRNTILSLFLGVPLASFAAQVSTTCTYPAGQVFDFSGGFGAPASFGFTCPQFNPALGNLSRVVIFYFGREEGQLVVQNNGPAPVRVPGIITAGVSASNNSDTFAYAAGVWIGSGLLDPGGIRQLSVKFGGGSARTQWLTPANFTQFAGLSTIDLSMTLTLRWNEPDPPQGVDILSSTVVLTNSQFNLIYEYTPVPEPAAWSLMLLALPALLARRQLK